MKRTQQFVTVICLLAILICASTSFAQFSSTDIPGNPLIVISQKKLDKTFAAISGTSTYAALSTIFSDPIIAQDLDYQKFLLEKEKAEVTLGYKLDGATLTKIITGYDLVIYPNTPPPGANPTAAAMIDVPKILLLLKVADQAKFDKLTAELEKNYVEEAKLSNPSAIPVKSETYGGQAIKVYQMDSATPILAMAKVNPTTTAIGDLATIKTTIDYYSKGGASLSQNKLFKAATAGLPKKDYDLFAFVDYMKFMEIMPQQAGMPDMAATMKEDYGAMRIAAGMVFEKDKITYDSYLPIDPTAPGSFSSEMARRNPPANMVSPSYIPEKNLLATWGNTLDGELIFDQFMKTIEMQLTAMGLVGPGEDPSTVIQGEMAMLESSLGFRIKDDLFLGIGPEAFFELTSVNWPRVEATVGVKIRDNAKIAKVLTGIESLVNQAAGAGGQGAGAGPQALAEIVHEGIKIKYFNNPMLLMAGYAPSYCTDGDFLLIGTTFTSLKEAISVKKGKARSIMTSPILAKAKPYIQTKSNSVMLMDAGNTVESVSAAIMPFVQFQLQPTEMQMLNKIIACCKTFSMVAGSNEITTTGQTGRGVILLNPKQINN